jgi:hypothetical protein
MFLFAEISLNLDGSSLVTEFSVLLLDIHCALCIQDLGTIPLEAALSQWASLPELWGRSLPLSSSLWLCSLFGTIIVFHVLSASTIAAVFQFMDKVHQ